MFESQSSRLPLMRRRRRESIVRAPCHDRTSVHPRYTDAAASSAASLAVSIVHPCRTAIDTMPAPPASSGIPLDSSTEVHTHSYLFTKVQRYIQVRDYETAIFLAERLIHALVAHASGENTPAPTAVDHAALARSLEAVHHLLALSQYSLHNMRANSSASNATMSATPAAPALAVDGCKAGGASYAYRLLQRQHALTEENQFFFAQCWYVRG
jgi:hypothetical protein